MYVVCVSARACVCACVCVCVRACVRACVCIRIMGAGEGSGHADARASVHRTHIHTYTHTYTLSHILVHTLTYAAGERPHQLSHSHLLLSSNAADLGVGTTQQQIMCGEEMLRRLISLLRCAWTGGRAWG